MQPMKTVMEEVKSGDEDAEFDLEYCEMDESDDCYLDEDLCYVDEDVRTSLTCPVIFLL
jgi:hypothetical protein